LPNLYGAYASTAICRHEVAVRYSDTESNSLAIRGRFQSMTLTFDHVTLNVCRVSHDHTLTNFELCPPGVKISGVMSQIGLS